ELLGPQAQGIFNADRSAAYPAMQQVRAGQITVAWCWAPQRRDFIAVERGRPEWHAWVSAWLTRISDLYRLKEARLRGGPDEAVAGAAAGQKLRAAAAMAQAAAEQAQPDWAPACRKVLASRTAFVAHPEVPMDNNAAERAERGPVVGRKNSYGSGAVWAGELAAMLFSGFQTLCLWGINPRGWLQAYLQACAAGGGEGAPLRGSFL